jgi:protein TonB
MKTFLIFCFSVSFLTSFTQDKNQFFALDANMNQAVLDSSKYLLWIHEKEDSNWQWDYYNTWGPLIKSQSFADHDGTILNGRSLLFNTTGNLDSLGIFDHGKKNGSFYKYRTITKDSVITIMQYDYAEDSLVKSVNLLADSIKNKIKDTSGTESEYPGGIKKWFYYLGHSLKYPDRAVNKEIQGQVRIFFMVDKEGNVTDPYITRSIEYSLDQESIRVIKNSGKWNPAFQDGVYMKSYKMMPINYKLEAQ